MSDEGIIMTIHVKCPKCGEMKVFTARTRTKRRTKALAEAAYNSKCWFCK